MTLLLDPLEVAWAAGFFDGEGNAHSVSGLDRRNGHANFLLRLSVSQSGVAEEPPSALVRFQVALGGIGRIHGPRHARGRKPIWRWDATSFEQVQAGIGMLWGRLGPVKRAQTFAVLRAAQVDFRDRYRHIGGAQRKVVCIRGHSDWVQMSKRRYCRSCRSQFEAKRKESTHV